MKIITKHELIKNFVIEIFREIAFNKQFNHFPCFFFVLFFLQYFTCCHNVKCTIKIFWGEGWRHLQTPPPYEQLLPLPTSCFRMFLERSRNDRTTLLQTSLTASPPPSPPIKNFEHTLTCFYAFELKYDYNYQLTVHQCLPVSCLSLSLVSCLTF